METREAFPPSIPCRLQKLMETPGDKWRKPYAGCGVIGARVVTPWIQGPTIDSVPLRTHKTTSMHCPPITPTSSHRRDTWAKACGAVTSQRGRALRRRKMSKSFQSGPCCHFHGSVTSGPPQRQVPAWLQESGAGWDFSIPATPLCLPVSAYLQPHKDRKWAL